MVMFLVYSYWSMTNDDAVRVQAERYLQSLTGGRVKIHRAHFRFFEGIELGKVTMYLPKGNSPDPFLTAASVTLRHRPWSLLRGKIEPTELVCLSPVVTLERNMQTEEVNIQQLADLVGRSTTPSGEPPILPLCLFRNCTFRLVEVDGDLREVEEVHSDMSMKSESAESCLITFEEQRSDGQQAIQGSRSYNFRTGKTEDKGSLPIKDTFFALPHKYSAWLKLYNIRGSINFEGKQEAGAVETWVLDLVDASMTLPAWQGGLGLDHVSGKFQIKPSGVTIRQLQGRIRQAGESGFELTGEYSGYETTSPFHIELQAHGLKVPHHDQLEGPMADLLQSFEKSCRLEGKTDLRLVFERDAKGQLNFSGQAQPQGMSVFLPQFPYALEHTEGTIRFDTKKIEFADVTARHGQGTIAISGQVQLNTDQPLYDLRVTAGQVALDHEVAEALPKPSQFVWNLLSPGGTADLSARLWRDQDSPWPHIDMTITADGHASMTYAHFPYPVEGIKGVVRVKDNDVIIEPTSARQGPMRCTVNGAVRNFNNKDKYTAEITVVAQDMPLDDKLSHALGREGSKWMDWMHPEGSASRITAVVKNPPGGRVDYTVQAVLEDVAVTPQQCPYRLEHAKGTFTVTPQSVMIHDFTGRHGAAQVSIVPQPGGQGGGQIDLGGRQLGIDLNISSPWLPLDQDLCRALPPQVARIWKRLSPAGAAGLELHLGQNAQTGEFTYRAAVTPHDMRITFDEFPYTFRGVNGTAVATPGVVEIPKMTAAWGDTRAGISGKIVSDQKTDKIKLTSVEAKNLPLDKALLAAMPGELETFRGQLKPGGMLDVSFSNLEITRTDRAAASAPAVTGPASAPASSLVGGGHSWPPPPDAAARDGRPAEEADSRPAAQPARDSTWSVNGTIGFKDMVLNLGQDDKKLTGKVSGTGSRTPEGLEMQAKFDLDKLQVGPRIATELHGQITKAAASEVVQIKDFAGKAYGGIVAGIAQIRLTDPLEYGLRLDVEGVDLGDLINAGLDVGAKKTSMAGKLSGRVQYSFKPGSQPPQQATGQMWITQAKLVKLPIMLDLLHVLTLTLPGGEAFTDGSLTYTLRGKTLVLSEIHFTGSGLSLVGSGTLNLDTEKLDLTFLTGSTKLPRIAFLNDLLEGISRELSEVRVTGTIRNPKMTPVPFHSIKEVIDILLNPGKKLNEKE
jgi:hypothetical protein